MLANPYLDFFDALPGSFKRHPAMAPTPAELLLPDWSAFKAAVARHFAWAVPTEQAIATIRRHADRVVEVGAGSGYWAWLMRQTGIDVAAYDVTPPAFTWSRVEVGDTRVVDRDPRRALFLCWPPWQSPMAADALRRHGGDCLIYVGEWLRGNADPSFFASLTASFDAVDGVSLPQWYARDDALFVFRRKGVRGNSPGRYRLTRLAA